jgi:hypothetical protein
MISTQQAECTHEEWTSHTMGALAHHMAKSSTCTGSTPAGSQGRTVLPGKSGYIITYNSTDNLTGNTRIEYHLQCQGHASGFVLQKEENLVEIQVTTYIPPWHQPQKQSTSSSSGCQGRNHLQNLIAGFCRCIQVHPTDPTDTMIVDTLIKALSGPKHNTCCKGIGSNMSSSNR